MVSRAARQIAVRPSRQEIEGYCKGQDVPTQLGLFTKLILHAAPKGNPPAQRKLTFRVCVDCRVELGKEFLHPASS